MTVADTALDPSLRDQFLQLGGLMRRNVLYPRLCAAAAEDPLIHELMSAAPTGQRRPVLFLAALHDTVLRGATGELPSWYASVNQRDAPPSLPDDARLATVLHTYSATFRDELDHTLRTRAVQTNEVGRSAVLSAGLACLQAGDHDGRPASLIELGASGGLNLYPDAYRIDYQLAGHETGHNAGHNGTLTVGPHNSGLHLRCDASRGDAVPGRQPSIATRIGFDRDPIQLGVADDARWLKACVWADDRERFDLLCAAIDIVAPMRPRLVKADVTSSSFGSVLGEAVAATHIDTVPTIMHSWVTAYLDNGQQQRLSSIIDEIGRQRDLDWIAFEQPSQVQGLGIEQLGDGNVDTLVLVSYRSGRRSVTAPATAHSHGRWILWRDRRTHPTW